MKYDQKNKRSKIKRLLYEAPDFVLFPIYKISYPM